MVKMTSLRDFETCLNAFHKCHGRKPVGIYRISDDMTDEDSLQLIGVQRKSRYSGAARSFNKNFHPAGVCETPICCVIKGLQ